MQDIEPTVVHDLPSHTGEGPLWHPEERCVYWVDIPNAMLFRHDPASGLTTTFDTDVPVGGFTIHEDGRLLLFMAEGAVKLWHDGRMETVIEALPDERGNRFNDVIADPEGRVFCGVMSTPERLGRLYRLDPDGSIRVVLEETRTANGMGFSLDLETLYFCDSGRRRVSAFDYERSTGDISNPRVIIESGGEEGTADGITVDAEGCIWTARWGGSRIVRHRPDGTVLTHYPLPAKLVSSLTFGGDDYTEIYATTAGGHDRRENGELAGSLFHLNAGVRGRPEFRSRLD